MRIKAVAIVIMWLFLSITAILVHVSVLKASSLGGPAQAAGVDWWPMFRHDLNHTGASTSTGPTTNITLWTYTTGGPVYSSPAIVNGFVYFGSYDHKVYCLNASTGAFVWSYSTDYVVYSSPAVVDGRVYVGSGEYSTHGRLYCLHAATGTLLWSYLTSGGDARFNGIYSSPAVVDGRVYFGCNDGLIYCLNATTGAVIWYDRVSGYGSIISSPAVVAGLVYVGATDGWIYCRNATNGFHFWSYPTGGPMHASSPAIVAGRLYMGSGDGKVYCLDATTGAHIWNYTTGNAIDSSPAVVDGRLYVGSNDAKVYCLDATTGSFIWSFTTGSSVMGSSPTVAGGLVYIESNDTRVYCLNANTGALVWSYEAGGYVAKGWVGSATVAGGTVYAGSVNGKVYAFMELPTPTIVVMSPENKTYTVNTDIPLNFNVDQVTSWVGYSLDGHPNVTITGDTTLPTLSDGEHYVTVYANNTQGKTGASNTIHFAVDATAPTGSIVINNGDAYTTSTSVTLTLTYSDATGGSGVSQVRYSNDGIWNTELWEAPTPTKSWVLIAGDGLKTVYYQIKDNVDLTSPTYLDTITLDTSPPQGSIQINNGAAFTNSTSVTLTLTYSDACSGVSHVRYSDDGSTWNSWESASTSKAWMLKTGDGTKTVYYQIEDRAGLMSSTYSDTIILDTIPPAANAGVDQTVNEDTLVTFNGSASTDENGIVTYTWTFTDITLQNRNGKNPTYTFNTPGVYIITLSVTDAAGNWATDTVTITVLDITKPVADAGQDRTVNVNSIITFDAGASIDNVGIVNYEWNFGDGTSAVGKTTTHAYANPGTYTVMLTVKDAAGNTSTDSATITVLPTEPFPIWIIGTIVAAIGTVVGAALLLRRRKTAKNTNKNAKKPK